MAGRILLCLAAACCCCLALLLPPVQGRLFGTGGDHRLLFSPEPPHLDYAKPTEQQVKRATPSWSPPPPTAGGIVTPELRWVPVGSNPLHNHGGTTTTQIEERTPPAAAAAAAAGRAVRPELRPTPWGANPLHN